MSTPELDLLRGYLIVAYLFIGVIIAIASTHRAYRRALVKMGEPSPEFIVLFGITIFWLPIALFLGLRGVWRCFKAWIRG